MLKLADYWGLLTKTDKEFLMALIRINNPGKYDNIHMGMLPLVAPDLKVIRKWTKEAVQNPYIYAHKAFPAFLCDSRQLRRACGRLRKHLSPALLAEKQRMKWGDS